MDKDKIKSILPFLEKQENDKAEQKPNEQTAFNKAVTNPILQEKLLSVHTNKKKKFSIKDLLR